VLLPPPQVGGLYKLGAAMGWAWLARVYVVPYLVVNFWLVMITLLQHTHPKLPHYSGKEWDWLRGALATVDRSYGVLDRVLHHIADTHVGGGARSVPPRCPPCQAAPQRSASHGRAAAKAAAGPPPRRRLPHSPSLTHSAPPPTPYGAQVCHHLFSQMPHYHAQEATEAIKPILGAYYAFDGRPILRAAWEDFAACRYVAPDTKGSGVLWFRK
jgi:hypothetical protein